MSPSDPDAGALARAMVGAGFVNPRTAGPFTEALLFGAGGGIGFMSLVFQYPGLTTIAVEGRYNSLYFDQRGWIENACERLGVPLRLRRMSSPAVTEKQLREALAGSSEVALTLDLVRLAGRRPSPEMPYSPHTVTVTAAGSRLRVTGLAGESRAVEWHELIDARWTGATKYGALYLLGPPSSVSDPASAIVRAVERTIACLLQPSRTRFDANFGVPGMRKWARLLTDERDPKGWPRLFPDPASVGDAMTSVVRGLGGADGNAAALRPLYASFLAEAARLFEAPELTAVGDGYRALGDQWTALVRLAGRPDANAADLSEPLVMLADAEEVAAVALTRAIGHVTAGVDR